METKLNSTMELKVRVQRINPHGRLSNSNATVFHQKMFKSSPLSTQQPLKQSPKQAEEEDKHVVHLPVAVPLLIHSPQTESESNNCATKVTNERTEDSKHGAKDSIVTDDLLESFSEQKRSKTGYVPVVYAYNSKIDGRPVSSGILPGTSRPCTVSRLVRRRRTASHHRTSESEFYSPFVIGDEKLKQSSLNYSAINPSEMKVSLAQIPTVVSIHLPFDNSVKLPEHSLGVNGDQIEPVSRKFGHNVLDVHHPIDNRSRTRSIGKLKGTKNTSKRSKKGSKKLKRGKRKLRAFPKKESKCDSNQPATNLNQVSTTDTTKGTGNQLEIQTKQVTKMRPNALSPKMMPTTSSPNQLSATGINFEGHLSIGNRSQTQQEFVLRKLKHLKPFQNSMDDVTLQPPIVPLDQDTGKPTLSRPPKPIVPPWYDSNRRDTPSRVSGIADYYMTYAESNKFVSNVGPWGWARGGDQQLRRDTARAQTVFAALGDQQETLMHSRESNTRPGNTTQAVPGSLEHSLRRQTVRATEQAQCIRALQGEVSNVRDMIVQVASKTTC